MTERHEAPTLTVERISHELRAAAEQQQLLTKNVESLTNDVHLLTHNMTKLVEVSNRDAVDILRLANIAQDHEDRLNNLEDGR